MEQSELFLAFNNSWWWVKTLAVLGATIGIMCVTIVPLYFAMRIVQVRNKLPDNVMFALIKEDNRLIAIIHNDAAIPEHQTTALIASQRLPPPANDME